MNKEYKTFPDMIESAKKYNHNHDELGIFSSGDVGVSNGKREITVRLTGGTTFKEKISLDKDGKSPADRALSSLKPNDSKSVDEMNDLYDKGYQTAHLYRDEYDSDEELRDDLDAYLEPYERYDIPYKVFYDGYSDCDIIVMEDKKAIDKVETALYEKYGEQASIVNRNQNLD